MLRGFVGKQNKKEGIIIHRTPYEHMLCPVCKGKFTGRYAIEDFDGCGDVFGDLCKNNHMVVQRTKEEIEEFKSQNIDDGTKSYNCIKMWDKSIDNDKWNQRL